MQKMAARLLQLLALWTTAVGVAQACPEQCTCQDKFSHQFADCAYKDLLVVPVGLPSNVTTISLSANKIKLLRSKSFVNVLQVSSLWLAHNEIVTIEQGTLAPLVQLKNLDISHNKIVHFPWEDLRNLSALQLLKINHNEMVNLPKDAFASLGDLRSLRINNNKFTTIVEGTFQALTAMSHLQISNNPFSCSCSLEWLRDWITSTKIAVADTNLMVCDAPEHLKDTLVTKIPVLECQAPSVTITYDPDLREAEVYEGTKVVCPEQCTCQDKFSHQFADCAYKDLLVVPVGLPSNVTTISLSANKIKLLRSKSFVNILQVSSLWLAHNEIVTIEQGTLAPLVQLKNLDISHNKIVHFPWEDLRNLSALQLLRINHNEMVNLPKDAFASLGDLRSLRINNNKFTTIVEGTFQALTAMFYLQISNNPFSCSCSLEWLRDWITSTKIAVADTNLMVCDAPEHLKGTLVTKIQILECQAQSVSITYDPDLREAEVYEGTKVVCPEQCTCQDKFSHQFADCAYKDLLVVPVGLPSNVTTISLSANKIKLLRSKSFVNVLQVSSLWLAHNEIVTIERGTLAPLVQLKNLDISHNKIIHFPWEDLRNLSALQLLKINHNEMVNLPKDAFASLGVLRSLRINNNKFTTIVEGTFQALTDMTHLQIFNNPFSCSCSLEWLRDWITSTKIAVADTNLMVCDAPEHLKGTLVTKIPILECQAQSVTITYDPDLREAEVYEGTKVVCPEQCTCQDKFSHQFADCAYKDLLVVPVGLPSNVTTISLSANKIKLLRSKSFVNVLQVSSLWLAHNEIVTIERGTLAPLVQLKSLDISHNKIVHFPWEDLRNLSALQLLKINHNEMVNLPKDAFASLGDLRSLRINNNKFTTIVQGTFQALTDMTHLQISNNPFSCSCSLEWLRDWITSTKIAFADTNLMVCDAPEHLKGTLVTKIPVLECQAPAVTITYDPDLREAEVYEGTKVVLNCEAVGSPEPQVRWEVIAGNQNFLFPLPTSRDNTDTPINDKTTNNRFLIFQNGSLVIPRVTKKEDGNYSCSAVNDVGKAESVVRLALSGARKQGGSSGESI